jgi:hypothetical protein
LHRCVGPLSTSDCASAICNETLSLCRSKVPDYRLLAVELVGSFLPENCFGTCTTRTKTTKAIRMQTRSGHRRRRVVAHQQHGARPRPRFPISTLFQQVVEPQSCRARSPSFALSKDTCWTVLQRFVPRVPIRSPLFCANFANQYCPLQATRTVERTTRHTTQCPPASWRRLQNNRTRWWTVCANTPCRMVRQWFVALLRELLMLGIYRFVLACNEFGGDR